MDYRNIQHYLQNGIDNHTQNIPCPNFFFPRSLYWTHLFTRITFLFTEEQFNIQFLNPPSCNKVSSDHEGPDRKKKYSSILSFTSALDGGGWSKPCHTPATLPPETPYPQQDIKHKNLWQPFKYQKLGSFRISYLTTHDNDL